MALLIKNGTVVTSTKTSKADIRVVGEKIVEIADKIEETKADKVLDASGKLVLPGVIDAHVHYFMKTALGRTADSFESGSASAAFGGVTCFVDFASPVEGHSLVDSLKIRHAEADGHSYIDYSFHIEITGAFPQNFDELKQLAEYGINSVKIYTTYGSTQLQDEKLPMLFEKARDAKMLVIAHAEDNDIVTELKERFIKEGKTTTAFHAESRPHVAETTAINRLISLAQAADCPLYIVHVSTGDGADIIKKAQANGLAVFGETCPHYLTLTDDCYKGEKPQRFVMTPPLRKNDDCETLWARVADGTLSCVVTDHCSFHINDKLKTDDCFNAVFGIGGSETLLPVMYSEGVGKGRISVNKLVDLLSTNPAKTFGLYPKKGTLAVESDADIVIFDPALHVALDGSKLHSAAEYTVFEGFKVTGYPVCTVCRGEVVCLDGELVAEKAVGKFVCRVDI